ncbi:MAG: chromosome segregation protein SMC [Hormoscilla sp. GM102CHS1]|nr:chromosome segregation protein SMC [Hormoscilla sp. GM102CHS1]
MVHIKRLELTNFKSFGGTKGIPLLPGFTVVSGPNGSGKSNILDALLFCLGLSSSKGMRAERLPDLINHNQKDRKIKEASVTVTFDLGSDIDGGESQDWTVSRRIRVTRKGYTSTYYINGETATLTELHAELNRLRIYPEGYNVVLQGDVTSIISMNSRARREIIDELAGIAEFDHKTSRAKEKLDAVKEREQNSRIIEKELICQRDRLGADRAKAEQYQQLRDRLQQQQQWEVVLKWRSLKQQVWQLRELIEAGDRSQAQSQEEYDIISNQISQVTKELDSLNTRVKALGEEEMLALQSTLATQQAEQRQLKQRQGELGSREKNIKATIASSEQEIQITRQSIEALGAQYQQETQHRQSREREVTAAQADLEQCREATSAIASAAQEWVQKQADLNRQIETILQTLDPQRAELAQLGERQHQLARVIQEQQQLIETLALEMASKQVLLGELQGKITSATREIQAIGQSLGTVESELQTQQETQKRLLVEQRDKQRQLDKLEAQAQAQQEVQGTYASKLILKRRIAGVCGLVAQLGIVEPRYQLALEIAAGGRMGNLVVEDDGVAAASIALLKQERAGRATFLPLSKIRPQKFSFPMQMRWAKGFIDYAINLIECDPRYRDIFAYVFGNTAVFTDLETARCQLGKCRIVTLSGELLEASGAMTGGSSNQRSGLHFGTQEATESAVDVRGVVRIARPLDIEVLALRERLQAIALILARCEEEIQGLEVAKAQQSVQLMEAKAGERENQLRLEQLQKEIKTISEQKEQANRQLTKHQQETTATSERLQVLHKELPALEGQLVQDKEALAELEKDVSTSEWQQLQANIRSKEAQLSERQKALRESLQRLQDLENRRERTQAKIQELEQRIVELSQEQSLLGVDLCEVSDRQSALLRQIGETQTQLSEISERLAVVKQERNRVEEKLRELHLQQQQLQFQLGKLAEAQQTRSQELETLVRQLETTQTELPDPLPEVPEYLSISQLQKELRSLQKRLQALEPVNMLAIEEYDRTQGRLEELTEKLTILEKERTELLLRIENFTTLRRKAFKGAFDAVNENFQTIFAELSDGDGYLQLEAPQDPTSGGLNLVAHPKGKPVQRLASMSGGEKSLTALSFIFALQRYRPSPFYAFDEVDMFLDGANVEKLAKMIKQQAMQAQFIVVSLRRPMIESSERTIGVTQARGAYTQVLGIKIPPQQT